jgi:hypothetical protein
MAKKLTDEMVAKACGWKRIMGRSAIYHPDRMNNLQAIQCPPFTTSLDAIVAEIEARGLRWSVELNPAINEPTLGDYNAWITGDKLESEAEAKAAPLALCAALLEFLKERE